MKINLVRADGGFRFATDEDYEKAKGLKKGEVVEAKIAQLRNYPFLKKYMSMIRCAWDFLPEGTREAYGSVDAFRESLQVASGHYKHCYSIARGEWLQVPKSVDFERCTEEEFSQLYERVRENIFQLYVPEERRDAFWGQMKYY